MQFCEICDRREGEDDHHVTPTALGGSNEKSNKLMLCPGCHKLIHKLEIYSHEEIKRIKENGFGMYFVMGFAEQESFSKTERKEYSYMLLRFANYITASITKGERGKVLIKEGLKRAKEVGTKSGMPIGRPPAIIPIEFKDNYYNWKSEKIMGIEFAKLVGVSKSTLYRYIKQYEKAFEQ